jgi:hypothetical protein
MAGLLAHLRFARHDLVRRLEEAHDPEKALPDVGLLRLLADVQSAITAIDEDGGRASE